VIDEGIGIPEAEREHVFEPFARGSNVGQISGTGLGLNIVKRYTKSWRHHRTVCRSDAARRQSRIPLSPNA